MNEENNMSLWNNLNDISLEFQSSLDIKYRRNNGIYYTGFELAYEIIKDLFESGKIKEPIYNNKFLEPCGGVGNFIFAYLKYIHEHYSLDENEAIILFKNIYYCEPDKEAKKVYVYNMLEIAKEYFGVMLDKEDLNIGGALIYNLQDDEINYISLDYYFNQTKFDIIVTNPPYKSLRAEKRNYNSEDEFLLDKKKYENIKKQANSRYLLSNRASSNIFKFFVEDILLSFAKEDASIGLLIPSSILTDMSCEKLRKEIIQNNGLKVVRNIPENNKYIDAQQALTYLIIDKGGSTNIVNIIDDKGESTQIDLMDIIDETHGYSIMVLKEEEYDLLNKLKNVKTVNDFKCIVNMRGELDLTLNKKNITEKPTVYRLVKGRNIDRYNLFNCENGFVESQFVEDSPKRLYIKNERIACQQIVNIKKERRLMFAHVPSDYVLGNSCNFLYVKENKYGIDLYFLLGLLNSKVLNWYFKLFSSNNHVNNYEIDNLPIPTGNKALMEQISDLSRKNCIEYTVLNDEKINDLVNELFECEFNKKHGLCLNERNNKPEMNNIPQDSCQMSLFDYGLDIINKTEEDKETSMAVSSFKSDVDKDAEKNIAIKEQMLSDNLILNNKSYKMSGLDMEIINSVPQGGNWQNIPQETMNKSQRLLGIQKSGGRTTLYGRLDYDKPSYTITTYFNRPGNGCYIHPVNDRVLTTREAARFQCFPDYYFFHGTQKDILNQIGNAVPTLIGYLIGKRIIDVVGCNNSLDLFSGAGGLLFGMKQAGINHVLANDFDKSACITLKTNNPELEVLYGDITKEDVKREIINKGLEANVDIICGGPPCQGFSLAGFRKPDDPRNKLFRDFYDVVSQIRPKVFVFENVIGILSYNKGKTYEEIKSLFRTLGYNVHGEALMFNEYGVPQRRKRVIVIGVRNDLDIDPRLLYPEKITESIENQITVRETISDLEKIETDCKTKNPNSESVFQKYIKGEISPNDYVDTIKK